MIVANSVGDRVATAYREGVRRKVTCSGFPIRGCYGPDDLAGFDARPDLAATGAYPYTRGIYPDMYRGRLCSRRELCGARRLAWDYQYDTAGVLEPPFTAS